jgi:lysophospholipase L1-like esterase
MTAKILRFGLAGLLLAISVAVAQTNQPAATNRCVMPIPRTDEMGTNRFAELNRRVQEDAGRAPLIFVGDSITQGWEWNGKQIWAKYYAPRHALNLGIGSDHTQHVLWRLDHGNLDGLHPKVAVVLIGVNNAPDESNTPRMILEGVTAVVEKLRTKLPETKILLLGIFPLREDFNPQRAKVLQVNQALHKLDDGKWVHFLDIGHLFIAHDGKIPKEMMRDFLHPSALGYQLWAEAMEPKLAGLLGDTSVTP